ncbi:hypothetical protein [Actinokineospora enzanensis]|nr:hypothetical protein [Actinokineospora enzanensis]
MFWHPLVLASLLATAALGGAAFVPWLFLGATAGFATSGST